MRARPGASVGVAAAGAWLLLASAARAYTYESPISDGCHEGLGAAALRAVRARLGAAPPIDPTDDEQALIDDVAFDLPGDMRDLGGVALILAERDNDLKGRHPTDTDQLALVHGDPGAQREHCLRHPAQDDPGGSEAAVGDCVAYIRDRAVAALAGLGPDGRPDPDRRVLLTVYLAIRGSVTAPLPRFHVRMGQALHALQDSFSHTLRTGDGLRVTTVLNWVEQAEGKLDERRDGPPHMTGMDRCDDPDAFRAERRRLAERASIDLLSAAGDPALSRGEKEAAIDAVLARWLTYEPGCTYDNGWCNAPELAYRDEGACGCRAAPASGRVWSPVIAAAIAAGFVRRRARRRGARR